MMLLPELDQIRQGGEAGSRRGAGMCCARLKDGSMCPNRVISGLMTCGFHMPEKERMRRKMAAAGFSFAKSSRGS